jgi:fatty acid kinase fatty acid binding subunit
MSGHVAVVTDSTAYLPAEVTEELGVSVVPLHVVIDGQSLEEGTQIGGERVAHALRADLPVTTSRPAPQEFVEVYRRLQAGGASGIVSVHLSGDISGTVDSARAAADEVSAPGFTVDVVDSRSLGMGLGFGVLDAARLAAQGAPAADVARAAVRRSVHASIFMYVDTLEYLRRGGRIGAAAAWLGSALTIKPLLHLVDGRLEPLDRVRTTERAITRLVEVVAATAGDAEVEIAVHHLSAAERAQDIAGRIREQLPAVDDVLINEVGAVIGAHVGPGAVGVVVAPVS